VHSLFTPGRKNRTWSLRFPKKIWKPETEEGKKGVVQHIAKRKAGKI